MPIKIGKQYLDSLRDGRRLYIDGKIVPDVTAYPPLQGVIRTIAGSTNGSIPGDPEINAQRWFRSAITRECEALVQELLKA